MKVLSPLQHATVDDYEHVLDAYKGNFLEKHDYIWAESERERLKRMWLHLAQQLSEFYIKHENYYAAVKVEEKVQLIYPEEDGSYFTLMKLYGLLNNAVAVEERYWLLKKMLQEQFTVKLSVEIEGLV